MSKHSSVRNFDGSIVEELNEDQCHFFDYTSLDKECTEHIESDYEKLAFALREIMVWLCRGNIDAGDYRETVVRKAIAMCWVVRPEIFNGTSLNKLCKANGINMNKQSISKQAQNFSKKFGVKGRGQK
jgi:hypothetical protein